MLTNRDRRFQDSHTVETGPSDHHKMTITVLKAFFQKQSPTIIKYRDYKKFNINFRTQLLERLNNIGDDISRGKVRILRHFSAPDLRIGESMFDSPVWNYISTLHPSLNYSKLPRKKV